MRAAGAVVGGLAGLICMYLTYAANGSSYEQSTTKAAVMVASLAAFSFVFGLLRFRFARYWFAFTVATFRWVLRCAVLCCAVLCCAGVSALRWASPGKESAGVGHAASFLHPTPPTPPRPAPPPSMLRCCSLPPPPSQRLPCLQHAYGGAQPLLSR